ncbi:hypothetical protein SDC9_160510 [bioreactor metagenome]|uniref:Polymerase beta nucleotidyltransferase domain-containing protein n=1 Tax=bioreactor metagenome TaxID=1076179 RepID=A0A645FGU4_9ZZZZ
MKKINDTKDTVLQKIKEIAMKHEIKRVILFGSRARGDNSDVSDYDIAIHASSLTELEKTLFYHDIDEIETLKKIDIVYIDAETDKEFLYNISRDGVIIYE